MVLCRSNIMSQWIYLRGHWMNPSMTHQEFFMAIRDVWLQNPILKLTVPVPSICESDLTSAHIRLACWGRSGHGLIGFECDICQFASRSSKKMSAVWVRSDMIFDSLIFRYAQLWQSFESYFVWKKMFYIVFCHRQSCVLNFYALKCEPTNRMCAMMVACIICTHFVGSHFNGIMAWWRHMASGIGQQWLK